MTYVLCRHKSPVAKKTPNTATGGTHESDGAVPPSTMAGLPSVAVTKRFFA